MATFLALLPILAALIPFVLREITDAKAKAALPATRLNNEYESNAKAIVAGDAGNLLDDRLRDAHKVNLGR